VIQGATLIDGTGNEIVPRATVVIENGVIVRTGIQGEVGFDRRFRVLEAAGKFLIPGLVEAHGHIDHPNGLELTPQQKAIARLYAPAAFLYNGVTTVVNLSSGEAEWILALRKESRIPETLVPRIFAGEHITAADGWGSRHGGAAATIADAVERVDQLAASGYDLTKIIYEDGLADDLTAFPRMAPEMLAAVSARSKTRDLPVFIHAIDDEEYRGAIDVRPRAIVHGLSSSTERLDDIASDLKKNGIYVVPTLVLFEAFTRFIDDPSQMDDPHLKASVPPFVLRSVMDREMLSRAYHRMDSVIKTDTAAWAREVYDTLVSNTRQFANAGVPLATGSDAGGAVVHGFQGYSTPRELILLVQCCLSPMDGIMASSVAAEMIGQSNVFGTLEPGKSADLLILNGNPLESITNVRNFDQLVVRGTLVERASLAYSNYRTVMTRPWDATGQSKQESTEQE
jgi:imidazolonepropionase-like amidohydrolase